MATTETLLTAEEFLHLPDNGRLSELVRGRIVMMNMPGYLHGVVCGNIVHELKTFLKGRDLGTVLSNDSGVVTKRGPDTVRGADVSFYSYERMAKGVHPRGYPTAVPELIFEVLSPDDRRKEVLDKVTDYLKAGVVTVCIVDPDEETVEVQSAGAPAEALTADQELKFTQMLPGFSVPVRRLFE
jgi:Uma2 family endonuclease